MAGDWLKMTHALPEKQEVLAIAGKTGLNRYEVVGRLFILWRWFDNNTTDGNADGVTSVTLEECLFGYGGNVGFVSAVIAARWLNETDSGISVVKFDEHISESAKARAQTAKRVAKSKANAKGNAEANGQGNGASVTSSVTKTVPREEKRREEEIHPQPRKRGEVHGFPPGFEAFWAVYPRKVGKPGAIKAFARLKPDEALLQRMLAAIEQQSRGDQWTKDGGQFIPHPATWINDARWEGTGSTQPDSIFAGAR